MDVCVWTVVHLFNHAIHQVHKKNCPTTCYIQIFSALYLILVPCADIFFLSAPPTSKIDEKVNDKRLLITFMMLLLGIYFFSCISCAHLEFLVSLSLCLSLPLAQSANRRALVQSEHRKTSTMLMYTTPFRIYAKCMLYNWIAFSNFSQKKTPTASYEQTKIREKKIS